MTNKQQTASENILAPVEQNLLVSLSLLYPHSRNFREHPPEQIKKLKASLERWGQVRSIVAKVNSDGTYTIVAGHGIVQAAQALVDANASYYERFGKLRVDVIPSSWSESQISGYLVADNVLSNDATDDEALLAELLKEQQSAGYDLASLGSDDESLRQMLESLGDAYLGGEQEDGDGGDEFDTTPEEGPTRTHAGELWQLGKHRLLVGDCTDIANIQQLMAGQKASLVFTDPPYGISYQANLSIEDAVKLHRRRDGKEVSNDSMTSEQTLQFLISAFQHLRNSVLCAGGVFYVCSPPGDLQTLFHEALRKSGLDLHQFIIWVKDQFVFGRNDYHYRHEPILYGWNKGAAHHFIDDRTQDSVWEIPRPKRSEDHPTMKPLELVERAINNSSNAGDIVFDGFLGSGTTLIASHRTGRICYGCELDPKYADVILRRFTTESGIEPELLESLEAVNVS